MPESSEVQPQGGRGVLESKPVSPALSRARDEGLREPGYNPDEILAVVKELYTRPNVKHVSEEELKERARRFGITTRFGNVVFITSVRNRSAGLTVYVGSPRVRQSKLNPQQEAILQNLPKTLRRVHEYVKRIPMICLERSMGDNDYFSPHCTLYLSVRKAEMVRLAYMWSQSLYPLRPGGSPHLYLVDIPEWQEKDRQILVFPEIGVTYVLGSDYFGEIKKGFLRMAMWAAKERGMLGLHAGAKLIRVRRKDGLKRFGVLIFGLTATGKTTHTCHNHGITGPGEEVLIIQDDVVFLRRDGAAFGPERGFYFKTEGLSPQTQPLLYQAVIQPDTTMENVMVDERGEVDFDDDTLTGNGRGIVLLKHLKPHVADTVNLPSLDELDGLKIFFIVRRNTIVPIISKLTPAQAAAAFLLGESVESTGGDPRRAGESIRQPGMNPFIIGSEAEEGYWFYRFVQEHRDKVECFLLNTGGVGEILEKLPDGRKVVRQKVVRPEIRETASIIRAIMRGTIEWAPEPYFNTLTAKRVEGVDMGKFELKRYYSEEQIEQMVAELKRERREFLTRMGVAQELVEALAP
jgi:phosphoenolpyruvate carboxykinase (ATP)